MKEALRYKFKIKRKYFMYSAREVADGAIADTVLSAFESKQNFLVYCSFGSEADTRSVIIRLLNAGKKVYLPRVEGNEIVPVPYFGDEGALTENKYGICEPAGKAVGGGEIDVCITPLLAVNSRGYRLGYGGGYYDRFFARYPEILRAGIGYGLQFSDEVTEDEWDKPLDLFISERGIIYFGRK